MKILFIPLEATIEQTSFRYYNEIRALLSKHDLIGLKRVRWFGTKNILIRGMKFIAYAVRTFWFGLKHSREIDLIYIGCLPVYALIGAAISILTGRPCVWAGVDNALLGCHAHKWSILATIDLILERIVWRFMKVVTTSKVNRQAYLKQGFDPDKIVVIPEAVDLSLIDEPAVEKGGLRRKLGLNPEKRLLIFMGMRGYAPNKEAADWINEELAPAIFQKFTDVQILMTGSGKIPVHIHEIVTFTGFVPNLYEYIHASDICIAPVWRGTGVLTKVLDCMACAKPTIVTQVAFEGIPQLMDNYNIIIVQNKDEFIRKTIYLLSHFDRARDIGVRAREMIEEHYNWKVWGEKLNGIVERCVAKNAA